MQMNSNIKEFENLSVEKKTLSTALGSEPRSFNIWSVIFEQIYIWANPYDEL